MRVASDVGSSPALIAPWCCVCVLLLAGCGPREASNDLAAPAARAAPAATATPAPPDVEDKARAAPASFPEPLAALHDAVSTQLGQPARVAIDERRGNERWVFVTGVAQTPGGEALDYAQTRLAERVADGDFDDWLCALLHNDGEGWQVVALEIGATDVPFVDWPERYGVPVEIVLPR